MALTDVRTRQCNKEVHMCAQQVLHVLHRVCSKTLKMLSYYLPSLL